MTYDVTGSQMRSLDAIVFPRFLVFREFSGMFVEVRDLSGVLKVGQAFVLGLQFGACASKSAPISTALFGFSVFFIVSYGMF